MACHGSCLLLSRLLLRCRRRLRNHQLAVTINLKIKRGNDAPLELSGVITMNTDIITAVPKRSRDVRRYSPPPDQEKKIRDALAYLVFKWQFFAQIIYDDMDIFYTHDVPIAATDSYSIFVNPDGMAEHGIDEIVEIVFVLAHEVAHRVLNHLVLAAVWKAAGQVICPSGAVLPYVHELMGMAKDYIVNAMLVTSKIGKMPKCGLYDPRISAYGMEPVAEIYEKLYKKYPPTII